MCVFVVTIRGAKKRESPSTIFRFDKDAVSVSLFRMGDLTRILERISTGNDPKAADELAVSVYDELRSTAAAKMAKERPGHTLQASDLAHEVWLKLFPSGQSPRFQDRKHFFGAVSEAMHRVLVSHSRRRLAIKRGADPHKTTYSDTEFEGLVHTVSDDAIEAVDEALKKFIQHDEATVELVKLRFFGGQSMQQAAEILGISKSKAERNYAYFAAWFRREFGKDI